MELVSQSGLGYRTKTMTRDQACRFARCINANPNFTDASVEESSRAKSEARWFVTFRPVNAARVQDIRTRQQDKRQATAESEGDAYLFVADKDGGRLFFWCYNPASGQTYEVDAHSCTCPDHHYRCQHAGLKCKHRISLEQGRGIRAEW